MWERQVRMVRIFTLVIGFPFSSTVSYTHLIPATVIGVEYDPNRTANIALICYEDGEKAYILAPEGLKVGQKVMNGPEADIRVGNCLPLELIPVGTMVHNVELHPGKGGQMVRSAGNLSLIHISFFRKCRVRT